MNEGIDKNIFNNPVELHINFTELLLTPDDIERWFGYNKDNTPLPVMQSLEELFPKAARLADIKAGYIILDPEKLSFKIESFIYESVEFDCKAIIGKRLRKSESIVLFLVSIGSRLEGLSKELMNEGDILKGYILDTIGSVVAERTADLLEVKIEDEIKRYGWKITNRYSPGYCGWYVMEQKKLFSFFPKNFCGVTLTDSALMLPIKSVSGVIGIGENVEKEEYECSLCDVGYCYKAEIKAKDKAKAKE